jgi:outer membrane protein assembly factor BamB
MRRLIVVLAVLALIAGGAVAAFVVHRLHEGRNVRGSSTVDFVTTETPAALSARTPWPQYGLTPERTRAVELPLRPPFRPLWRYQAGSLVEFPPAIGYHRLFFSTNVGVFTAVAATDGTRAWIYRSHRCVAASPAIGPHARGTVYETFLNRPPCNAQNGGHGIDGKVIAFSVGHGQIHWQRTIGPSETSPLLVGDRLYVGDWNGWVWALNTNTGRTIWKYHAGGAVKGGLASAGGRLYVGSYDGHVYCLSHTGRLVWRASAQPRLYGSANFYSTPAVAYGRVYIGSTDGRVYSFGAATGKLRWSYNTGNYVYASPAVWRRLVFAGSYNGSFYAFDAATGDVRWRFAANGPISGSATVIGGVVYFATLQKRTYALDARNGRLLWTFPDGKYTPAVAAEGRLYLTGYQIVYGMVPRR